MDTNEGGTKNLEKLRDQNVGHQTSGIRYMEELDTKNWGTRQPDTRIWGTITLDTNTWGLRDQNVRHRTSEHRVMEHKHTGYH
ncbi:hypothetical protein GDO81_027099 [Engystomops pustulosus]|uniref:Uncharacterized protein n=1 Tax=Engystomops pustulosus TaxID=76066 RepID=A0AAV6ZFH3_ENGPU|nr:hypothetical protein GDO81_027099 [Engystomops pustulosus]